MDATSDISHADYQRLAEFRYQLRRFLSFSEQAARAAGLEPRHHQALLAITGGPDGEPPTVGLLAERLQIKHHSAVELVDRLAEHGLIVRVRDGADRRQVLLRVTEHGAALLRDLTRHHLAELQSAGPALVRTLQQVLATRPPEADGPASDADSPAATDAGGTDTS